MKDLEVFYQSDLGVNLEFDEEVESLAKKFGLVRDGSGFDFEKKVRDIHFVKQEENHE